MYFHNRTLQEQQCSVALLPLILTLVFHYIVSSHYHTRVVNQFPELRFTLIDSKGAVVNFLNLRGLVSLQEVSLPAYNGTEIRRLNDFMS